ncbi:response regulator [Eubacterium multiforme]|uniref:Stage 0 sporulation protein A homolog n=1 Tax=Eubacterium multiforme TaxID=83339 RepID=A0ABT9UWK4_9FIRM|nr:response regulator [Eubacterium multiforme]MDQ0150694.1 two-component system response regulator YesN [Eubacterium multiforme]
MKKVLLVDDEIYSLRGMEVLIPWEKLNCLICGVASDSVEAINIAKKEQPNIIVTDINMPGINGLDMIEKIREDVPKAQGIVITGYDDFKYAIRAIKLNVIDFILKPVNEEELISAVKKAISNLEVHNNVVKTERKLLDIMRGETDSNDIKNYFSKEDISILLLDINRKDEVLIESVISEVKYLLEKSKIKKYYIVKPHNNRIGIVREGNFKDDLGIVEEIQRAVLKNIGEETSIAITNTSNVYDIHRCYEEGKNLLMEKFYVGYNSIILNCKERNKCGDKEVIKIINNIDMFINSKNYKIILESVDELYKELKEFRVDRKKCEGITLDILLRLKNKIDYLNSNNTLIEEINIKDEGITIENLKAIVETYINKCLDLKREYNGVIEDRSILKAISIIEENYMNNILLKDVAKELFLNESYFSRIFKKTIGVGFNEYVTKLRIEKAIKLLKEEKSIKTVSEKVGYTDYRNFSLNFKKYTGYTPREYIKDK